MMEVVAATNVAWTEVPRHNAASIVLQSQGYGEVTVAIGPDAPTTLEACGLILNRLDPMTFSDFVWNDRIWVKSHEARMRVLVWR